MVSNQIHFLLMKNRMVSRSPTMTTFLDHTFCAIQDGNEQNEPLRFQFADWDGDGIVDLVASRSSRLHYFKQGICFADNACHASASCDKKTGRCESRHG